MLMGFSLDTPIPTNKPITTLEIISYSVDLVEERINVTMQRKDEDGLVIDAINQTLPLYEGVGVDKVIGVGTEQLYDDTLTAMYTKLADVAAIPSGVIGDSPHVIG